MVRFKSESGSESSFEYLDIFDLLRLHKHFLVKEF